MRITYDVRMAMRQLTRQPGFTSVVIFTLALGIGANSAVFSVVDGWLVRPLPYHEPQQLGFLWTRLEWIGVPRAWMSGGHIAQLQRELTTVSAFVALRTSETQLTGAGDPEQIRVGLVTANFTDALGVQPIAGRPFRPEDDLAGAPRVILLSHSLWTTRFGADPSVVGRRVEIGRVPHEIIGVMGPQFRFLSPSSLGRALSPEAWVPGRWDFGPMPTSPYSWALLVRAKPGRQLTDVRAELDTIGERLDRERYGNKGFGWALVGMRDNLMSEIRPVLWLVQAAALLVLLVASANVGSLILVRTAGRARELALRAALGAARTRIVRQLAMESTVLAAIAAIPAIGLAYVAVAALKAANPPAIPALSSVAVDGRVMLATAAVTLLAGIVFGVMPLVQLSRRDLRGALQDGARTSGSRGMRRLRAVFVTAQIATALVLIASAVLLIRTFAAIRGVDPGFVAEDVVTARVTLASARYHDRAGVAVFFDQVLERLSGLSGVTAAGATSSPPLGRRANQSNVWRSAAEPSSRALVDVVVTTPGYVKAAGLTLLRGRDFESADRPERPPVAILDAKLAHTLFGDADPIGQTLVFENLEGVTTVVGVVKQAHLYDVHLDDRAQIYLPLAHMGSLGMTMVLRTQLDPAALAPQIKRAVADLDPAQPVADIRTLTSAVDASLVDRRLAMTLLTGFGGAALILATVGLYGLLTYIVNERTREIGIRLTLGAQATEVRWMILRRSAILASAGLVVGLAGAYASRRLLETQLFAVSPTDAATLAGVAALLLLVALAAGDLPARRAMAIDPVKALRAE
jgi:predicted permease